MQRLIDGSEGYLRAVHLGLIAADFAAVGLLHESPLASWALAIALVGVVPFAVGEGPQGDRRRGRGGASPSRRLPGRILLQEPRAHPPLGVVPGDHPALGRAAAARRRRVPPGVPCMTFAAPPLAPPAVRRKPEPKRLSR